MGGFIVLEDGRAYAASNWATDAVLRAVAAEVEDEEFRRWLREQQAEFVGMGLTTVDLRELTRPNRETFYRAARRAFERARAEASTSWPRARRPMRRGWGCSPT